MKFSFEVGDKSKSRVEFSRNWFTGRTSIKVNGESATLASPWDVTTHVSFQLTEKWQFGVEGHEVVIEKIRPLLFAGFRPQKYFVYVDQALVEEFKGL